MKYRGLHRKKPPKCVAPLVGAWIEIVCRHRAAVGYTSLPSWERGLKFPLITTILELTTVAPLVGAWIEMIDETVKAIADQGRSPRGSVD